jgi:hypothetical protein
MEKAMECFPTPEGQVCINPPPILCEAPSIRVCSPADPDVCRCEIPTSAMLCEVRISYAQNDPAHPTVAPMAPYCDGAGVELAIALILAKSLGATK